MKIGKKNIFPKVKLDTCPLCGGECRVFPAGEDLNLKPYLDAVDRNTEREPHHRWMIRCDVCGLQKFIVTEYTEQIEAEWNSRAGSGYEISCNTCWVKCEGSFEVVSKEDQTLVNEKNCIGCVFNGGEHFRWKISGDIVSNMSEDLRMGGLN